VKTSCEYFGNSTSLLDQPEGEWFGRQFELVRKSLEKVNLNHVDPSTKATEYIRQSLVKPLKPWSTKVLATSVLPPNRASSNYRIDYQVRSTEAGTDSKKLISLELVFDNRQAVGTNLLKLESSARQFVSDTKGICMSLIVAPSQNLKDLGFWDNSVATGPEYSWAIRKAYSFLISHPLVLITVS
jgi:hypothetical protein